LRWRIDKKYVDLFKGFLETSLRPVPPHDIIFPTKKPTSCNIWSKEVFINEREEKEGRLEWAYRHECGHLAAFPRTVGEDFKNFYRARYIITLRNYNVGTFTKYYPLIANIAYDLIIDTELIMNYPSVKEKARELLRKARSLPRFIHDALEHATEGYRPSWIEPDAPHNTIVRVYEQLRDVLEKEDETVMALVIGCPSGFSGSSSACSAPMGGAGGEGDEQSDGKGKRESDERGSEGSQGCGGGLGERRGGKRAKDGEGAKLSDEGKEAEEGGRKSSPEPSGQGRGGSEEGHEGRGRRGGEGENGRRDEDKDKNDHEDEGEGGQRGWPSPFDVDHGPISCADVLPVAAELIEEGEKIDNIVAIIADYVECVNEWREKQKGGQGQRQGGGSKRGGGQQGQPASGAGFGRGPIDVPTLKELVLDAYVERCFSLPLQVLPRREGFVGVLPRERSSIWRLGDPIDELDVMETVRSYGVLVPGHTTVRAREVPMVQKVGRLREGSADIVVIVDQSGSMRELMPSGEGQKYVAARNTALALLGWARYIGADARLMTFSNDVVIDSGWVEARRIKEVAVHFAAHYYPLNNTVLSSALHRIDKPKATVYVIGDFELGDWNWAVRLLPKLASLDVLLVLLLIGREYFVRLMADVAREQGVKVRAYSVDSPRAMLENALRELKI
jgi:hypothetical protein